MDLVRVGMSLGLFIGSLMMGWLLSRQGVLSTERASLLIRQVITYVSPPVLCLTLWGMQMPLGELWMLPLIGLVISTATLLPALIYAKKMRLDRARKGSFLACAFFSNVGYLGAFVAFAMFGETAYGLCVLYMVLFIPTFFTFGFWVARYYGTYIEGQPSPSMYSDKLRLFPLVGLIIGILLNVFHVPRPEFMGTLNMLFIPAYTALYLTAIGSQLTFEPLKLYLSPAIVMSFIKFLYSPLIGWLLVTGFKLQGMPRFVVLLQASMPVAVSPLMLPLLFGLDKKLSNAMWVSTTAVSIPWLLIVIPLLQKL